jgi:hypothetical protein
MQTRITNVLNTDLPRKDQQQPEPEPVINGGWRDAAQRTRTGRTTRPSQPPDPPYGSRVCHADWPAFGSALGQ